MHCQFAEQLEQLKLTFKMVYSKILDYIGNFLSHPTEYSDFSSFLIFRIKSTIKLAESLTYFTDILCTRKVDANLSILHDAVESHNPFHVDRVHSLYIYCTEILMRLQPSANKAIGSGISAYFLN